MADLTDNNSTSSASGDDTIDLSPEETGDDEETIKLKEDEPKKESAEFTQNLAETLPKDVLDKLAAKYIDFVKDDLEAREDLFKRYADGLKQTGLTAESPSAPAMPGGSDLVYPVLTESAIDFQSSVISEIFPAGGPVKISPTIDATLSTLDKARRKQDFLNREITNKIPAYKAELEKLLSQLPLSGAGYRKFWYSPRYKRIGVEFLPVDKVAIPYNARSFYDASRVTIIDNISVQDIKGRIRSGLYIDFDVSDTDVEDEDFKQEPAEVNEQIEGKYITEPAKGFKTIFETYCDMDLPEDDMTDSTWGSAPYVMTIDVQSKSVVGLYRNWEEDDETGARKDYIAEWGLIPWRGAYSIGLTHIAGPLARYLSGILKVMIDNASLTTIPWGLVAASRGAAGQNIMLQPGEFAQVELPAGMKIQDAVMPVPFSPAPPAIFQLFEILDKTCRGILQTSLDQIGLDNTTVPVGTQMARIEQGLKVYKAIYSRMHESLKKELQIICRLYSEHMEPIPVKDDKGQIMYDGADDNQPKIYLCAKDFEDSSDLAPVSDPDVFSETQRLTKVQFAQQMLMQLAQTNPGVADMQAFARVSLERLNYPDIDQFMPGKTPPSNDNPAVENVKMASGQLPTALPDQDHMAHIASHLQWYSMLGDQVIFKAKCTPFFIQHCSKHITLYYVKQILEETNRLAGEDVSTWNIRNMAKANELAELIAKAHKNVCQKMSQELAPLLQTLGNAQIQLQQSLKPPMPPTPEQLLAQVQAQKNQNDITVANAKVQLEAQDKEAQRGFRAQELALKKQELDQKAQSDMGNIAVKTAQVEENSRISDSANSLQRTSAAADIAATTAELEHKFNQQQMDASTGQQDQTNQQQQLGLQAQQQAHGQMVAQQQQALAQQQQAHSQSQDQQQLALQQQQQAHAQDMAQQQQQMAQQAAQNPPQPIGD